MGNQHAGATGRRDGSERATTLGRGRGTHLSRVVLVMLEVLATSSAQLPSGRANTRSCFGGDSGAHAQLHVGERAQPLELSAHGLRDLARALQPMRGARWGVRRARAAARGRPSSIARRAQSKPKKFRRHGSSAEQSDGWRTVTCQKKQVCTPTREKCTFTTAEFSLLADCTTLALRALTIAEATGRGATATDAEIRAHTTSTTARLAAGIAAPQGASPSTGRGICLPSVIQVQRNRPMTTKLALGRNSKRTGAKSPRVYSFIWFLAAHGKRPDANYS